MALDLRGVDRKYVAAIRSIEAENRSDEFKV
jgi:hypothetical protein